MQSTHISMVCAAYWHSLATHVPVKKDRHAAGRLPVQTTQHESNQIKKPVQHVEAYLSQHPQGLLPLPELPSQLLVTSIISITKGK